MSAGPRKTALKRGDLYLIGGCLLAALLLGGLWLLLWQLAAGGVAVPRTGLEWRCVLFLAVFPTGVAFLGWNEAQKGVSLSHLSFLEYLPPLVAAAVGTVILFGRYMRAEWYTAMLAMMGKTEAA